MSRENSGRFVRGHGHASPVQGDRACRLTVQPVRSVVAFAFAAVALSSVGGCMTAKIEEVRDAPTRITSTEAVVLLAKPHLEGTGTENKFLNCLERELVGESFSADHASAIKSGKQKEARSNLSKSPFQIYAGPQFVDAFYPWLEPSTAPVNPQTFSAFLARPGVAERVTSLGVRFIVWVDGTTQKTDGGGSIACAVGPGGAGCLGLGWWEKQSDYEATVWDLRDGVSSGTVSTDVKGTSVMIGAVAPIPIISPVQSTACDRLATQLKSFLVGTEDDADAPPKQIKAAQ
ncbi:MAG TPA: hypothetical protein VIT67_20385 [Povalibacter sp.]